MGLRFPRQCEVAPTGGRDAFLRKETMNTTRWRAVVGLLALALVLRASARPPRRRQTPAEYQSVLDTLGRKGDYKGGVLKANIPRNDLKVTVDGVAVPTAFGFGGWVAMTRGTGGHDVMMGDLVLLQEEVNPVMSALLRNGLDVTACTTTSSSISRASTTCTCTVWGPQRISPGG